MKQGNQAFLFQSHSVSTQLTRQYGNIRKATARMGNSFFLYHQRRSEAPSGLPGLYLFSNESLSRLNYRMIGPSFSPGHTNFPLLQFFRDHPDFDHYWLIENDVRFSGDWYFFFDTFGKFYKSLHSFIPRLQELLNNFIILKTIFKLCH